LAADSKLLKQLENPQQVQSLDHFLPIETRTETSISRVTIDGRTIPFYVNEFWTSKQRQASSLHEVSYRACFKPQLPRFFIETLTKSGDVVYDPFSGRGTSAIEAALLGRGVVANDINPLGKILGAPRLNPPNPKQVQERLSSIKVDYSAKAEIDLSMFYDRQTEAEIVSLKNYLLVRKNSGHEDFVDDWIRMVATNRLTGHSPGFFSVYTLPPNQAVAAESQIKINQKLKQIPEYRDTKKIILRKTLQLLSRVNHEDRDRLERVAKTALFLTCDARSTPSLQPQSIRLTVTSPPFLDVVQYSDDNWLRCWFNAIDDKAVAKKITLSRTLEDWILVMREVFGELFRLTQDGGWVAFEVGEIRSGKIKLEEHIVPVGLRSGFVCHGVVINSQSFTKTSNIWGIRNNKLGTNTNRVVLFQKEKGILDA